MPHGWQVRLLGKARRGITPIMMDLSSLRQHGWRFWHGTRGLARRHALSLALTAAALTLTFLFWPLSQRFPFALFITAVLGSVWRGGPREGLIATGLATLALAILYLADGKGLDEDYLPRLGMFVLVGLIGCYLGKQCQQAIQTSEQVQNTLGHLGCALVFTDLLGRVTYLNPVAETLTGWSSAAAAGQALEQVLPLANNETGRPLIVPTAEVLHEGAVVELDEAAVLAPVAGGRTPVEGNAAPVRGGDGQIIGLALALRNVSSRRQDERDGKQRADALVRASEQRLAAALRQAQDEHQRRVELLQEAETALRSQQEQLQKDLRLRTAEKEQAEKALKAANEAFQRQLGERSQAQREAEEALRKAREDFERQLAVERQATEPLRKAQADHQRQLDERDGAKKKAEDALRKQTATLQRAEEQLRQLRVEVERRQSERDSVKEADEAARAEAEQRLAEQAAARQRAEDALRQAQTAFEQRLAGELAAAQQLADEAVKQAQEELQGLRAELAAARSRNEESNDLRQRLEQQVKALQQEKEEFEARRVKRLIRRAAEKGNRERVTAQPQTYLVEDTADWLSFN